MLYTQIQKPVRSKTLAVLKPTKDANPLATGSILPTDVEEAEDDDSDLKYESPQIQSAAHGGGIVYDVSLDDEFELDFMVFCLFQDMHKIRLSIHELWMSYAKGELDLLTATITTNTAIGLLSRGAASSEYFPADKLGMRNVHVFSHRLREGVFAQQDKFSQQAGRNFVSNNKRQDSYGILHHDRFTRLASFLHHFDLNYSHGDFE